MTENTKFVRGLKKDLVNLKKERKDAEEIVEKAKEHLRFTKCLIKQYKENIKHFSETV